MVESIEAQNIEVGRLLSSAVEGFSVGTSVSNIDAPYFGALVKAPASNEVTIYGLIHNIYIDEDGLVRQLVTATNVSNEVIQDNRDNRNVPLEMKVLTIGYSQQGQIRHLLPSRPPLSLDIITLCSPEEIREFTEAGRFGYFRHILRNDELPISELIATHIQQAHQAHLEVDNADWVRLANQEIITLLRDEYDKLMPVLAALADVLVEG